MPYAIILFIIVLVLAAIVVVFGGLYVALSYAVGLVLMRFLPLTPFELTLLSMLGIAVMGVVVMRLASFILGGVPDNLFGDEHLEDVSDEEDEEDENAEIDDDEEIYLIRKPRRRGELWRPASSRKYSGTDPDARCPCGSGRKYKNCHGK